MTRKDWKVLIVLVILTITLSLSPFLPGPSFLYIPTNIFYSCIQLASVLGLLLIPIGLIWAVRNKSVKKLLPLLCWIIPVVAFVSSIWIANYLRDASRTIAIENAETLITAIEEYKIDNNKYPDDLSFMEKIPKTWIMGIKTYSYEKTGTSYEITFTQNVIANFNFEIVIYNPTDEQKAEGELTTLYETGKQHWKYYIYD